MAKDEDKLWCENPNCPLKGKYRNPANIFLEIQCRGCTPVANLNNDVTATEARALHRVVRAMHDGNCPMCGLLEASYKFVDSEGHTCPRCGFFITHTEAADALETFRPFMELNVAAFEKWRAQRGAKTA